MKVWIPYAQEGIGGPYTFTRLFRDYLARHGHTAVSSGRYDILLAIADSPLRHIIRAKLAGKPIVHRLDGVYSPALPGMKGRLWWLRNARPMIIHTFLADHIIYQSKFCRQVCEQFLGQPRGHVSVIYNGVHMRGGALKTAASTPIQLVSFARFRRRDQIAPLLTAVQELTIPYELTIIGPHTADLTPIFARLPHTPHVRYAGPRPHDNILRELSKYDIMLFSDLSYCPNAVLEAQAAGVPVVAYGRGAASELIADGNSGKVIPLHDDNPLHTPAQFTAHDARRFAQAIKSVAADLPAYRQRAISHAQKHFMFDAIADKYMAVLSRYAR